MREQPKVLLLGSNAHRLAPLRATLSRSTRLVLAEDLPDALALLAQGDFSVVFCDRQFHCGNWRQALETINAVYRELPVVIISPTGIEEGIDEWAEIVEAGAFDLLLTIRDTSAVLSVLEQAVASREARAGAAV